MRYQVPASSNNIKFNDKPNLDEPRWYAIYTRSNFEKKIHKALNNSGYQVFLPMIKEKRIWSDRVKSVQVPLLPGYVFLKISDPQSAGIYNYPGFVRFVYFDGKPSEIKEEEINLLQDIIVHGFSPQVTTYCKVGDLVRVMRGPLKGYQGLVERVGQDRIRFQFNSIQQALSVEVGISNVEKV